MFLCIIRVYSISVKRDAYIIYFRHKIFVHNKYLHLKNGNCFGYLIVFVHEYKFKCTHYKMEQIGGGAGGLKLILFNALCNQSILIWVRHVRVPSCEINKDVQ